MVKSLLKVKKNDTTSISVSDNEGTELRLTFLNGHIIIHSTSSLKSIEVYGNYKLKDNDKISFNIEKVK